MQTLFYLVASVTILVIFYVIFCTPIVDNFIKRITSKTANDVKSAAINLGKTIDKISVENKKQIQRIKKEVETLDSFEIKTKNKKQ